MIIIKGIVEIRVDGTLSRGLFSLLSFELMLRTKFRYNPENLRYERVKISFFNVLLTLLSYITFGILFFTGLLLLQNYFIETPAEKKLRSENEALSQYKVVLAGQLSQSNNQLEELKKQDLDLYEKLFDSRSPEEADQSSNNRDAILLAEPEDFNVIIE